MTHMLSMEDRLVLGLRLHRFDTPVRVIFGRLRGPLGHLPWFGSTLEAGGRRVVAADHATLLAAFVSEVSQDLRALVGKGVTKYGLAVYTVHDHDDDPGHLTVRYAKVAA